MDSFIGTVMLWSAPWIPSNWAVCDGRLLQISQYQALFAIIGTYYGGDGIRTFALPDLRQRVPVGAPQINNVGLQSGAPSTTPGQLGNPVTLTAGNLPAHTHTATFTGTGGASGGSAVASGPVSLTFSDGSGTISGTGSAKIGTTAPGAKSQTLTEGALLTHGGAGSQIYTTSGTPVRVGAADAVSVTGTCSGVSGTVSGTISLPVTGSTGGITGGTVAIGITGSNAPVDLKLPTLLMNYIICLNGIFPSRD
ncbi:tail fiber protein [Nitrospirillum sp. BR 11752]|uniref:phage tail protein n=1 Tax=Nitrospirillum sp. BR 11752 TaxID=3104293 RepID=UPI002EA1DE9B|nr:tail fiber protein [Nitrospirillum sp. BR 11752]